MIKHLVRNYKKNRLNRLSSNWIPADKTVAVQTTGVTCAGDGCGTPVLDPNDWADCVDCCKGCKANVAPVSWWDAVLATIWPITPACGLTACDASYYTIE